jgi:hypothetical protein
MKLFGIFDLNQNYKLLRYSQLEQIDRICSEYDRDTNTYYEVHEVCLPEIDYSEENIGKTYNIETQTFNN